MEKISIVIPVYKVEAYIRQCLDSVVGQTYQNLEIICVDDGSPDRCGEICDAYAQRDSRIQVIHKKNGGVSSARNVGIEAATGEWIYFMDPDDWIEPNLFELCWENAKTTKCDMVFFRSDNVIGKTHVPAKTLSLCDPAKVHLFDSLKELDSFLSYGYRGSMCCCVTKAHIIKDHVRFIEGLAYGEDYIFRIEVYRFLKSFSYIPDILYHYRKNVNSALNTKIWDKHFNGLCRARKTAYELVERFDYPANAEMAVNSFILNSLVSFILNDVFDNSQLSNKEKKLAFNSFLFSDIYQKSVENSDPRLLNKLTKLALLFKHPPTVYMYFLCWLRRMLNAFRAPRNQSGEKD